MSNLHEMTRNYWKPASCNQPHASPPWIEALLPLFWNQMQGLKGGEGPDDLERCHSMPTSATASLVLPPRLFLSAFGREVVAGEVRGQCSVHLNLRTATPCHPGASGRIRSL